MRHVERKFLNVIDESELRRIVNADKRATKLARKRDRRDR